MPDELCRRFDAVVFDWDGTAVPDRDRDATRVRELVERLCDAGMHIGIVSGTHLGNIDGQLRARPSGPGSLLLALNRGSECFAVDRDGPRLLARRRASPIEDQALDLAATETVRQLARRGLEAEIVSTRLNRRKIDLIPVPEWQSPPKAVIDRLYAAVAARLAAVGIGGLDEVVAIAEAAARASGLPDSRITSDVKHVEIGLTDKRDAARWLFDFLRDQGVTAGLVLVAGDEYGSLGGVPGSDSLMLVEGAERATTVSVGVEPTGTPPGVLHLGGGPERFVALLADQLERRRRGEVPEIDHDPAWVLALHGRDRADDRTVEALLTLADGNIGSRGTTAAPDHASTPAVLAAGLYDLAGSQTSLLSCPSWQHLPDAADALTDPRWTLDLRSGVLHASWGDEVAPSCMVRFSSLARPGSVVLRARTAIGTSDACEPLVPPHHPGPTAQGRESDRQWMQVAASQGGVAAAASQRARHREQRAEVLERLGAYVADPHELPDPSSALECLEALEATGFERLLNEHRRAWATRWRDADVTISGDPSLQHAVRFALFHLLSSAADEGEAAVGARGLTGPAYRGHVFWDADVFVLPTLTATHPSAARAMLEYRARRLPAARAAAAAEGRAGARFPWESARSGRDVTPTFARDRTGRVVPIDTGALEIHIVGCVAWAAAHYLDWTGDTEFAAGAGGELLSETARYWASRLRLGDDGRAHLDCVIGPDEYHVAVDDNAFTNGLARWNLRRAAALETRSGSHEERDRWLTLADALVDGYEATTQRYEQFAGFFDLEPLLIADVAPRRPIAAELLLGAERVEHSQVIKQADVLMLHHLLPDEVAPGSLVPNLDYYEPRTAHGSTLSPGVHASLLARAGRLDAAVAMLELTSRIDLDDITKTTTGGLHLAALGSVWQALAFGFLGLRAHSGALSLDPKVPEQWGTLEMRLRYQGARVTVRAEPQRLSVSADRRLPVVVGDQRLITDPTGLTFARSGPTWRPSGQERQEACR